MTINIIGQHEANISGTKFIVFSDPHYYDASLGTKGKAFQKYLDHDRKLLRESKDLLQQAIGFIAESDAPFVLIPGDLTKDGSLVSHKAFSQLISDIEKSGKQVFVVPGNHDIANGDSKSYNGDTAEAVESITAEGFKENYKDFGYDQSIFSDPNSLSYVVEPSEGIWVLGLDACMYNDNESGHHPHTDGKFSVETLNWIATIAEKARSDNKRIIAFMHHGIIEHYKGQEKYFGEYIVNDYKKISKRFADLGINIVFTGHYHAQDITVQHWKNGSYICDIETGSLVTYPSPLREISIHENMMKVSSMFIQKTEQHPTDFASFSKEYVHSGISGIAERTLISYKLKPDDAAKLSGQIADAFVAHYQGDEMPGDNYLDTKGVSLWGKIIIMVKRKLIVGLYHDLPTGDNQVIINLENGLEVLPQP